MRGPIYLLGVQGAGKSTIGRVLGRSLGGTHLSAGTLLRLHGSQGGKWATEINSQLPAGQGVDTKISYGLLKAALADVDDRASLILDGFPREVDQLSLLRRIVGCDPGCVLLLDASREVVIERLIHRRSCEKCDATFGPGAPPRQAGVCDHCGGPLRTRPDDNESAIPARLDGWASRSIPILDYFRRAGILVQIDASGPLEQVAPAALRAVEDLR